MQPRAIPKKPVTRHREAEEAYPRGRPHEGTHLEALLPPHIVVLTPSQLLEGDRRLYSLENVLVLIRDYICGYPDEHWDYLRRLAAMDPEFHHEINRKPIYSSSNQFTEQRANFVLDSHFHWLRCEMQASGPI